MTADEADAAKYEVQYEAQIHKDEFVEFDFTNEKCRVDNFFGKVMQRKLSMPLDNDNLDCIIWTSNNRKGDLVSIQNSPGYI